MTCFERGIELPYLREAVECLHDVCDRRLEPGIAGLEGLRLDQNDLALLVGGRGEARLDQRVGRAGLADCEVARLEVLRADGGADDDGRGDEREPAEDRGLPVVRAPAAHPGRDVVRSLER